MLWITTRIFNILIQFLLIYIANTESFYKFNGVDSIISLKSFHGSNFVQSRSHNVNTYELNSIRYNIPYDYLKYSEGHSYLFSEVNKSTRIIRNRLFLLLYFIFYRFNLMIRRIFKSASKKSLQSSISDKTPLFSNSYSNLQYIQVDWDNIRSDGIVPILAIVNRKSGGQQGDQALINLQKILNNIQICDLSSRDVSKFLKFYKDSNINLKIIVCGGDGTFTWVMDEVYSAGLYDNVNCKISYGLIPFGTGNDLFLHVSSFVQDKSQFFKNFSSNALVTQTLKVLDLFNQNQAYSHPHTHSKEIVQVDRWSVAITPKLRRVKRLLIRSLSKKSSRNELENQINGETVSSNQKLVEPSEMSKTDPKTIPNRQRSKSTDNNVISAIKKYIPLNIRVSYRRLKYDTIKQLKKGRTAKVKVHLSIQPLHDFYTTIIVQVLNNYMGIGVDGDVAMSFSELRRKMPYIFIHKLINKVWYAIIGLITFLFHRRYDLVNLLDIYCDGIKCKLPEGTQGVIITNINSYAGGSKLWKFGNYLKNEKVNEDNDSEQKWISQKADDGIIEVVAVYGVAHLGQIKTGLSKAIPVAQGKSLQIITSSKLPMQVDGEPFFQRSCKINIGMRERVDIMIPASAP